MFAQEPPQQWSNLRTRTMEVEKDSILLDSLSILPNTLSIKNAETLTNISDSLFYIHNSTLIWKDKKNRPKRIIVSYRVLPFSLRTTTAYRSPTLMRSSLPNMGYSNEAVVYNPFETEKTNPFAMKGLEYSGSYSRGLSFGNNQSLVLNSNMNLQIAGDLGNEMEVTAAFTDNNIPLQPEGNTQELQDFDKIYIQVKRRKTAVILGDYEISRPKDRYFINYFKRLQGITLKSEINSKKWGNLLYDGSIAVSRGKFAQNKLTIQEGNQGPYRLTGADGERFVIILAGSERVFIDGQLATRGSDSDYIIDYNTAELVFTPKKLMTKDIRVIVEFQYSDLNYLRTLYAVNASYQYKKWGFRYSVFSEKDAKNQSLDGGLDTISQRILQNAGDDPNQAVRSGILKPETGFNPQRVMYRLKDTLVYNRLYTNIVEYSTNPEYALYLANFTAVGIGKGNYQIATTNANGRVYQWIAPDSITGAPRGEYEPILQLITPKKKELQTLQAYWDIQKNAKLSIELGISKQDLNTFSKNDDNDNTGFALRADYTQLFDLGKDWKFQVTGFYEGVQNRFRPIDDYRNREFKRDWNTDLLARTHEHWAGTTIGVTKKDLFSIRYQVSRLLKDSIYNAWKHEIQTTSNYKKWILKANTTLLNSENQTEKTLFLRPKIDVSKSWNRLKIGAYFEQEYNERKQADTLLRNSFHYYVYKLYAEMMEKEESPISSSISWLRRHDFAPENTSFLQTYIADQLEWKGAWEINANTDLIFNFNYRNLQVKNEKYAQQKPQETYLGRLEFNSRLLKGFVNWNTVYEIGTGQQPKTEFSYIKVNAGEGGYSWLDRNNDSIPQLNEFEIAVFRDQANYIRISNITNQFIRSNNVLFSQRIDLQSKYITKNTFWERWAWTSLIAIDKKTLAGAKVQPYNPFLLSVPDTSLVTISASIQNSLFFNRNSSKFTNELKQSIQQVKLLLSTGADAKNRTEYSLRTRWNMTKSIDINFLNGIGKRESTVDFFSDRNYYLNYWKTENQIAYQYKQAVRIMLQYKYQAQRNTIGLLETARIKDWTTEWTFAKSSKSNIRLKFSYINIRYTGRAGTPIEFAMLEGLRNGKNLLWSLNFNYNLTKNMVLQLSYEGRKTGEAKMVHIGRAQVTANF